MLQDTSLEAYKSIMPELGDMQQDVYYAIAKNPGMSNHDIARYLHIEINRVTPRVKELRDLNLIVFSHYKQDRITQRTVMCWRLP